MKERRRSMAGKLTAYSLAAGAAAIGAASTAVAAPVVYDYRPPNDLYALVDYWTLPKDIAVVRTDGSYKYVNENTGPFVPIVAGDLTPNSVWIRYETFTGPVMYGSGDQKDGTNVHANPGSGVAGTSWVNAWGSTVQDASQLPAGSTIDGSLNFFTDGSGGAIYGFGSGGSGTGYGWTGEGFLGYFLQEFDGPHYGWVHVYSSGNRNQLSIYGWAYETTANTGIVADYPPVIPEPVTLGLLSLGAAGLMARRRKSA